MGVKAAPASLDAASIRTGLTAEVEALLADLEIHQQIDSTNSYLMAAAKDGASSGTVCLAEQQTAGRGRRGRHWVSPFAANLYLSLLWRFELSANQLQILSPLTGIAVARALRQFTDVDIMLKWPNDLLWQQQKIGGILLESSGNPYCYVVTGIGINVAMPDTVAETIGQAWADLHSMTGKTVCRNTLAALLINALVECYQHFATAKPESLRATWQAFDGLKDCEVTVKYPQYDISGIARGIDESGALLLEKDCHLQTHYAGEVSLRLRA